MNSHGVTHCRDSNRHCGDCHWFLNQCQFCAVTSNIRGSTKKLDFYALKNWKLLSHLWLSFLFSYHRSCMFWRINIRGRCARTYKVHLRVHYYASVLLNTDRSLCRSGELKCNAKLCNFLLFTLFVYILLRHKLPLVNLSAFKFCYCIIANVSRFYRLTLTHSRWRLFLVF